MRIDVEIAVRVRIVGLPDDAQLAELMVRVRARVATRLGEADDVLQRRHGVRRGGACEVREAYDGSRDVGAGYAVPSYDLHGHPVGVPLRAGARRPPARPWTVLRTVQFQTVVGLYLIYLAEVEGQQWALDAALYADLEFETRWVGAWWVQVNRDYRLSELGQELTARAGELAHVGEHRVLSWGVTPFEHHRRRLAGMDETGQLEGRIPDLHEHNARRVQASDDGGGDLTVRHGSWVLYTFMTLPKIELTDVLTPGPALRVDLPTRNAGFLIDIDAFRAATGITWQRYTEEFPDDPVPFWAQSVTVRRRVTRAAALLLLDRFAGVRTGNSRPGTPGVQAANSLFLLTSAQLAQFPSEVRGQLDAWSDDATRANDAPPAEHLEVGQRVAYALAWVDLAPDRLGQASYGPLARSLARRIVDLLADDPRDLSWLVAMGNVFWEAGTSLTVRPPGGTPFEYVLAELERLGRFDAFLATVDASGNGNLRYRLMLLCLATRFADRTPVARLRADLSAHALAAGGHTMVEGGDGVGEIWLDHDVRRKVRVGQVFGDVDDVYTVEKELKQLKVAKAQELRDAIEAQERAMAHDLFAGLLHGEYDGERFAREAMTKALNDHPLTNDDFETIKIERSMRLRRVILTTAGELPQYRVYIDFVQRLKGSGGVWQPDGTEIEESADDFGARLTYWELGRAGEFYTAATIAISVVGLALVAWEAGIVALLVEAAGGTAAVVASITISELLYLYQVIFHHADFSLRGILTAALDGYLMALSFRWAGGLGRWGARALGTATTSRVVLGWFTERIIVGTVGGGLSAVLERFVHESIGVALGEGTLSGVGDYLRTLGWGAVTGIVMEFTVAPVMHAALSRAGSALGSAAELAALVRREGWGALEWSAAVTEGLSNFRSAMSGVVEDALADGWTRTLAERMGTVARELGANTLSRRVLELSGARFTRAGTAGLSRYLAETGSMSADRAVSVANALARNPAEAVHFFEVLSVLEAGAARHLATGTFGSQAELAEFLGRLSSYSAAEQRGILRLLGELGIEARTPTAAGGDVLARQFSASLRVQAEGFDAQAQQLQAQAAQRLQRAAAAGNPTRAARITAEADQLARDAAALRERARLLREEAGAPSRQPQLPPAGRLPVGAVRRIVYLDHNVVDQIVRGNADAAQTLLALRAAGVDLRMSHWTWRELVLNPTRVDTQVNQRLIIEDLGIVVDDAIPMERRVDDVLTATPPRGHTGFSPEDTQVAIGARAGNGEIWSFDGAFRTNPGNARARFGLAVAPESAAVAPVRGAQDFARARQLLGLDPIEILSDGSVVRGRERLILPSGDEAAEVIHAIGEGTPPPGAGAIWIRLSAEAAAHDAEAVAASVRPVFRSRTGNRVVFRVEGGNDLAARSHESLRVDAGGNVTVVRAGRALNLNFGVFERASEFLIEHRRGARLVVFEVEEGWFQSLRSAATPDRGQPAVPGGPNIGQVTGVPRTVDVRFGQDQVQIPDSMQGELQEFIVPGSGRVVEFTP